MKVLSWVIALCGLWEFADIAAIFVPGFGTVPAFLWNHILLGLIMMIVGVRAALTNHVRTARTMNWIAAIAGVALILGTFVLRDRTIAIGMLNDLIVGVVVAVLGAWAALTSTRR